MEDDEHNDVEVPGLDDNVTPLTLLQFTLDCPFEKQFTGVVRSDSSSKASTDERSTRSAISSSRASGLMTRPKF